MALITITINTDNAAFEDNGTGDETARLLKAIAAKLEDTDIFPGDVNRIIDINGNV